MAKLWQLKPIPVEEDLQRLYNELCAYRTSMTPGSANAYWNFSKLLLQRGISSVSEAKSFNDFTKEKLHSPWLMEDMDKAVTRIIDAITQNQPILVYGDYDVDGTTAVAVMVKFLRFITPHVAYYIPDRYTEGYGVSAQGIQWAKNNNFKVIISLDCGIKAHQQIADAQSNGIDFIVCDHHTPGETLPPAYAILDPKKSSCTYPYKELSGCAIGYKLAQAIAEKLNLPDASLAHLLQLVAISLACDIVPLTGENRVLCAQGLTLINQQPLPSIAQLLHTNETIKPLTVTDLVFGIGPKINAAGRISSGKEAVQLLLENEAQKIQEFSERIEAHNKERKEKDKTITQEALAQIANDTDSQNQFAQVLYAPHWHKGVIGIVASRVIESHYKPTIILTQSGTDTLAGSVRSVSDFDVYQALLKCESHMIQFGGHKYAAGLTMQKAALPQFKKAFNQAVKEMVFGQPFQQRVIIDLELQLAEINTYFKSLVDKLAPFGPQNMAPTFMTQQVVDNGKSRVVGEDKTHLKLGLTNALGNHHVDAIAFGFGHLSEKILANHPFDIVYTLDMNYWKDTAKLQLLVRDIRFRDSSH